MPINHCAHVIERNCFDFCASEINADSHIIVLAGSNSLISSFQQLMVAEYGRAHLYRTSVETVFRHRGDRLEELACDRLGQHSIRVNDQWRICFLSKDRDAYEVEIVDYH